jgi:hypothetical protein
MNVLLHTAISPFPFRGNRFHGLSVSLPAACSPRILDDKTIVDSALKRSEYPPRLLDLCRQEFHA